MTRRQRTQPRPLAQPIQEQVPAEQAMTYDGSGRWRALGEAEVHLPDYMRVAFDQIGYVLCKPDAMPQSRELAERALQDHRRAERFLAALEPDLRQEVWNCMRLVLEVEGMAANELHARAAHVGGGVILGGRKAAHVRNSSEADRELWRKRFAELRARFPEAKKKALLGMIADKTGETERTLRRYIKAK